MYMYGLTPPPRAGKRPWHGAEDPTFLIIKIEIWNLVRIYGVKIYEYIQVNSPMDRETALCGGPKVPFFKSFLFVKVES